MPIKNRYYEILDERVSQIRSTQEEPQIFVRASARLFPTGCCCPNCAQMRYIGVKNPIETGEEVYWLHPNDTRISDVMRAVCVANYQVGTNSSNHKPFKTASYTPDDESIRSN